MIIKELIVGEYVNGNFQERNSALSMYEGNSFEDKSRPYLGRLTFYSYTFRYTHNTKVIYKAVGHTKAGILHRVLIKNVCGVLPF